WTSGDAPPPGGRLAPVHAGLRSSLFSVSVGLVMASVVAGASLATPVSGAQPGGPAGPTARGTVYIESNSAAPGSNQILAFRYINGVLGAGGVRRYSTGGSGSHDLSNSGVLDADQEVITNADRTLLFSV